MAEGNGTSSDSGMRRRRSGEHDETDDDFTRDEHHVERIVTRTSISDDGPVTRTTAADVSTLTRPWSNDGTERAHISIDAIDENNSQTRKSDEITSTGTDKTPSRPIEPRRATRSSLQYDGRRPESRASMPSRPSPPQPSPSPQRSRTRGMSLRTALFNRNIDRRADTRGSTTEMRQFGQYDRPRTSKGDFDTSVTVTPITESSQSNASEEVPTTGAIRLTSPGHTRLAPWTGARGISALSDYPQWVRERVKRSLPATRIKEAYHRARKIASRIQEIPPSKNGRHIPIDPFKGSALIDERTGHAYVSNFIKSSKYTTLNFLPRQLVAQFSKLANLYFLSVSILQMIPGLSTTGTYTTIIPLMFFISISMAKEGYEDLRRHRLDKAENNQTANVLRASSPSTISKESAGQPSSDRAGPSLWTPVKWQSVQVGDIVRIERDEPIPADIMLLHSKGANNVAYVETMALDGETNLKTKQPSAALNGVCSSPESLTALENAELVVEDPNLDLYNFEGKLSVNGEFVPLTNNEIVYRGSILRNTPEAIGIVVYSGEECKIRMNANKNPRIKAPALQKVVNKIVLFIVIFVVSLAILLTILYQAWHLQTERRLWYLTSANVDFIPIIVSFIIMFNTMIPLSLYVSLEIIKVAQIYLMNDIDMYDAASNTPFEARTSTINEELGQVSYIFSDKTGTLTENVMRFRKLSVAGTAWLHDADLSGRQTEDVLLHKKRKSKGKSPLLKPMRKSTTIATTPPIERSEHLDVEKSPRISIATWTSGVQGVAQPEMTTAEMIRYIQRQPQTAFARKTNMMLLAIALCHTCLPELDDKQEVKYQASSPDELALVQAARELGYFVFDREASTLTIKTYPNGLETEPVLEKYEILDIIEFSSKRKRMSVVVRMPDGRVSIICKGADSAIVERLRLVNIAREKITQIEKRVRDRRSVEAQEVIRRKCSTADRQNSVGSVPRPSVSRLSVGRPSIGRPAPTRSEVDAWLNEREQDVILPVDASHYTPRPSAQVSRPSAAISERPSTLEPPEVALVDESLVLDESAVIERCFQHVNDFATEGLRTLLYGHRFLTEEEYSSWKAVYQDATTSLNNRQEMIEAAGELIERDLELTGATAIEDKLQEGVPETIDRLRRADIKLWMLTGDKRETAINIGHSCRLIKEYSSVTILKSETGRIEEDITTTITNITQGSVAHSVIVIDGHTLSQIQANETLHTSFLGLAILTDTVISCRASPAQKAHLVHAIRRCVHKSVTLAIGDGANDIAMIREAHVGIGITGKEGLQAARTSDYAIAQFRYLNKLLLVHGRWNYVRTCKYTLATFWKEMLFFLTQALFQRYNGYTGTSLYEQWSLSQFNTLFTSLPVIFLGIFEKDLAAATLLAVPELYRKGQRAEGFNFRVYFSWMFMAVSESIVVVSTMIGLFGQAVFTPGKDLFSMGDMTFTACIIIINSKLQLLEQRNRTVVALICMLVEIGGWFVWNVVLSLIYKDNYEYNVKGGFLSRFGRNPLWWLCLLLIVAACLLFEIAVRAWKNALFPTDVEIFQQLERDLSVRRRFEEASAELLQAGWQHGGKKSSLELRREAEEQARREGEVEDLLNKPRGMEEGRREGKKSGVVKTEEVVGVGDEDRPPRRSVDVHEILSMRFGKVRKGELKSSST